jgi:PhnB protein
MAGPPGMLIPHLVLSDAAAAMEFYKRAFDAQEVARHIAPDGKRIMHGELTFGDSILFLCDEFPEYCGGKMKNPKVVGDVSMVLHQNVQNCDAAIKKAQDAGAKVIMPAGDQFWGDRYGIVEDPFGYQWSFSHPLKR